MALSGMEKHVNQQDQRILGLGANPDPDEVMLPGATLAEKIALKDAKLRTFIADDGARDDLVAHAYDITYGTVQRGQDQMVVIDDSIRRHHPQAEHPAHPRPPRPTPHRGRQQRP